MWEGKTWTQRKTEREIVRHCSVCSCENIVAQKNLNEARAMEGEKIVNGVTV